MDKETIISIVSDSGLPASNGSVLNDPISRRKFIKRTGGTAAAGFLVLQGFRMNAWATISGTISYKVQLETSPNIWKDLSESERTVVGREVKLRIVRSGDNALVSGTITWSMEGMPFVAFTHSNVEDGYNSTMPSSNPVSIWFAQSSMKDPNASPQTGHEISALFQVNGVATGVTGKIVVLQPDPTLSAVQETAESHYMNGTDESSGLTGMYFNANVDDSKLPTTLKGGKFGLCQLVDWDRRLYVLEPDFSSWFGKSTKHDGLGYFEDDGIILDSQFLVPTNEGDTELDVGPPAPGQGSSQWADAPGFVLDLLSEVEPSVRHAYIHDQFSTYLMYRPAGESSKWIPLKKMDWWFKVRAARVAISPDNWEAFTPDPHGQGKGQADDCSDHPKWKSFTKITSAIYRPYVEGEGDP